MRIIIPMATYFITKSTFNKIPIFENKQCANIFVNALKFLESKQEITIHTYVLMLDHYHLLVTLKKTAIVSKFLHSLNSYTAHRIKKIFQVPQVWDDYTWDEVIRNEDMYYQKMAYILLNPYRKKLVKNPFSAYEYSNILDLVEKYGMEFLEDLFRKYKRFWE